MKITKCEKNTDSVYKVTVQSEGDEFEDAVNKVYQRQKKRILIAGFRKGKAPRKVVERLYGANVFFDEATEDLFNAQKNELMKEAGLAAEGFENLFVVEYDREKGITIDLDVIVAPEASVSDYIGAEIEIKNFEVTEEVVDKACDKRRGATARIVTIDDRATLAGDIVTFDFKGICEGEAFKGGEAENYRLELGSKQFIPGFEDQMIDRIIEEPFYVNVTFPPEFVKDISEFDTVEEFREDLRVKLEERAAKLKDMAISEAAAMYLVEHTEAVIPDVMLSRRKNELANEAAVYNLDRGYDVRDYFKYSGSSVDEFVDQFEERATQQLKLRQALLKIAKDENIGITEEVLEEEYEKLAEKWKMPVDEVKIKHSEQEMKADYLSQQALEFVKEHAVIKIKDEGQEGSEEIVGDDEEDEEYDD